MSRKLMIKGNEAVAEAAIRAGCRYYAGYPITPQTEILEYLSWRLPQAGGRCVQPESELAAIYLIYGASAAGARAMTSTSGPGISLMQEGISYMAGAELPAVIVNMGRAGPGMGGIHAAQSDYFMSTKGGGHGDYRLIVLAPSTVQEAVDLTILGFHLADKYRMIVTILGDAALAHTMEAVAFPDPPSEPLPPKDWVTTGARGRTKNTIAPMRTIVELEEHNRNLQAKFARVASAEARADTRYLDDAEIVVCAFGTVGRIAKTAVEWARADGVRAGLIRPITLWPFPSEVVARAAETASVFLTTEMNAGQMVEDVRLAVEGRAPVEFYGRPGGPVTMPEEIHAEILRVAGRRSEGAHELLALAARQRHATPWDRQW